jgi:hypothetical protein
LPLCLDAHRSERHLVDPLRLRGRKVRVAALAEVGPVVDGHFSWHVGLGQQRAE